MVARLPLIDVTLPVHEGQPASVTWNGEPTEADEVKRKEDGGIEVVIAGVTYDEHNAEIHWRQETI
jgi:hypothetical protein